MSERPGISLEEWYPEVAAVVPTPRTIWHKSLDLMPLAYGSEGDPDGSLAAEFRSVVAWLANEANAGQIGWPAFLRTGLTSGKHDWPNTCYLPSADQIARHVSALCEVSATVDFFGLPADVWVLRQMLPTEPAFTAFRGMPITKERRYFIKNGTILGWHPYWPPEAFEEQPQLPRDWRAKLAKINEPTDDEVKTLTRLSLRVSDVVPGAWSVDWLWVPILGWHLTDMAWAEQSFVWSEYPTAPTAIDSA